MTINLIPDDKIIDWSKLKQLQTTFQSAYKMKKLVPYRVENCVRKGEIACSISPFLIMFSIAIYLECFKMWHYVVNQPLFLRVCNESLLKTLREKETLLVTSNFSFSHSVFYPFGELSLNFVKFEIVVCKLFQFRRV